MAAADSEFTKMECDSSSPDLDAELAEKHKFKGNAAYKVGSYTEACDHYTKAIYHNPNSATYWSNRSAALMMLQDYTAALEDCTQAIKLDDSFTKGYLRAAKCYLMTGNPSLSIDYYMKVLKVERKNKQALAELKVSQAVMQNLETATTALESGHFHKAIGFLQRCLEEAPLCIAFRSKLAEALVFSRNYSEAKVLANDLLKLDNNNVTALYVKAMCDYYQDNTDRAMQFFHHALRVDPDHSKSRLAFKRAKLILRKKEEGNSCYREGNHERAHEIYTEALEVDPQNIFTNAKLYCNRALVGSKTGRLEEAIKDCTEAISLDPEYMKAYHRRAQFHQESGHHDDAVRDYEIVFKKDPSPENKATLKEAKKLQKLAKRKDYYKILGLGKSASTDDIRKAYRKQALLHHPDRHVDADESVRKDEEHIFKEVSEAYSILSDSQKRARYDGGHDLDEGFDMDFDANDLFSNVFNFGFGGHSGSHHFSSSFSGPGGMHFQF